MAPLSLAAGKHRFAEIHAATLETCDFHPSPIASQQADVFAFPQGDALPIVVYGVFVRWNGLNL